MNKGIIMSKGEYILFLGSDDCLHDNNVLSSIFSSEIDFHRFSIIYGNIWLEKANNIWGGKFNIYRFILENLPHQAVFYHKTMFEKYGLYKIKYQILADKVFNLRWFRSKSIKKKFVNRVISNFSGNGISSTSIDQKFENDKFKLYKKYIPFVYRLLFKYRKRKFFKFFHKKLMLQRF